MSQIVICGGGIAGVSTAVIFAKAGYSVTLIEKYDKGEVGNLEAGEVIRSEAVRILNKFGFLMNFKDDSNIILREGEKRELWHYELGKLGDFLYNYYAPEYPVIHAMHKYIVKLLYKHLEDISNVDLLFNTEVTEISDYKDGTRKVTVRSRKDGSKREFLGNLVIVADGSNSSLRTKLGVPTEYYDYNAGYLMLYVSKPTDFTWGRFYLTKQGFVGVFPTSENMIRIAVELTPTQLKEWLKNSDDEIITRVSNMVGMLKGCKIIKRGLYYHVVKRHVKRYVFDGLAIIGDAAHTTHPMLGQGMAMVFNDVEAIYETLIKNNVKEFNYKILKEYEGRAKPFNTLVLENNHKLFFYFHELIKNSKSYENLVKDMIQMGFVPTNVNFN